MGLKTVDQLVICLGQRRDFNRPLDIIHPTIQHWRLMGKLIKLIYLQPALEYLELVCEKKKTEKSGLKPIKGVDNRKIAIYHVIVFIAIFQIMLQLDLSLMNYSAAL